MLYAPTVEQTEFSRAIRAFVERRSPESALPAITSGADRFDRALWADMAGQLELHGLAVPEHLGGSGFGYVELGLVFEELGRALVPTPFFATAALALPLLVACHEEGAAAGVDRADIESDVRAVVAGRKIACAAVAEPGRAADRRPRATVGSDGRLSGRKILVIDGDLADLFVVSALDADGTMGLYLVSSVAAGVSVEPQSMLDPTRGSAEVGFDAAPATRIDQSGAGEAVLAGVLDRARVALAFEQLGGAARCLEIAVEHAKTREQFGRPIGSFQAVQHMCADVLCDVEAARSAAWYAAWALTESSEELSVVIPTTKFICSEAYLKAARTCVHVLGGIGFTWEHPAQLFFKRATSSAQFLGAPGDELVRLADRRLGPSAYPHEATADADLKAAR